MSLIIFKNKQESVKQGITKDQLRKEVKIYLEEMGFEKKTYVIRWMGIIFLKICFMMKIKLFVNEAAILKVILALFFSNLNLNI